MIFGNALQPVDYGSCYERSFPTLQHSRNEPMTQCRHHVFDINMYQYCLRDVYVPLLIPRTPEYRSDVLPPLRKRVRS